MSRNDIIDLEPVGSAREDSLKTWGWVSYLLHLIVAVAAVVPGAQVSIALLIIALVLDLVKKDDAAGTWQASHFSWRIRSAVGRRAVPGHLPAVPAVLPAGRDRLGGDLDLVPLPHRAGHGAHERRAPGRGVSAPPERRACATPIDTAWRTT